MKKFHLMLIAIACIMSAMVSCSHSPEKISKREIIKETNRILKNSTTYFVSTEIEIGTYECNDDYERQILRKLEAANLITYDVERIAWWEKSFKTETTTYYDTEYFWGWSYKVPKSYNHKKPVYDFSDHYIVTVALTEKGQKYVIENMPEPIDEEELTQPEIDLSSYDWIGKDLSEDWDNIENPFIKKETPKDSTQNTNNKKTKPAKKSDGIERIDSTQYKKYQAFKADTKKVRIKLFEIEACDASYIRIKEDDNEIIASAIVTLCTSDVSDFARAIYGVEDDQKAIVPVTLSYFMDKGWVIKNKSLFIQYVSKDIFDDIIGKAMNENSSNNPDSIDMNEIEAKELAEEMIVEEVADTTDIWN